MLEVVLFFFATLFFGASANRHAPREIPKDLFADEVSGVSDFTRQYITSLRSKFEQQFEDKCTKYPFVKHYYDLNSNEYFPSQYDRKYMIYTFHNAKEQIGGIGDRVAGVITGFAYSLRGNRTFLLHGDKPVEMYFQPRPAPNDNRKLSWATWKWAQYDSILAGDLDDMHCVNVARPKNCYLDFHLTKRVFRYVGNRAYLCRWAVKRELAAHKELQDILGVNEHSDLFEVSGCLLRLILHPTETLWRDLARYIDYSLGFKHFANHSMPMEDVLNLHKKSRPPPEQHVLQVGMHFRCGDAQMHGNDAAPCIAQHGVEWKGIDFYNEMAMDSPIDIAKCAVEAFKNMSNLPHHTSLAFVSSDNRTTAVQMNNYPERNWYQSFIPSHVCHVDENVGSLCEQITYLQWFQLSMSDMIITQSIPYYTRENMDNPYSLGNLQSINPVSAYPSSAFSRYAVVYGFTRMRFGKECRELSTKGLALHSQSNWRCDPMKYA